MVSLSIPENQTTDLGVLLEPSKANVTVFEAAGRGKLYSFLSVHSYNHAPIILLYYYVHVLI